MQQIIDVLNELEKDMYGNFDKIKKKLDKIEGSIDKMKKKQDNIISILHEINYNPENSKSRISEELSEEINF